MQENGVLIQLVRWIRNRVIARHAIKVPTPLTLSVIVVPSGIRNLNIGSLPDLVKAMTDKEVGIKLRDRKYFLKTYKNVFDGS